MNIPVYEYYIPVNDNMNYYYYYYCYDYISICICYYVHYYINSLLLSYVLLLYNRPSQTKR